MQFIVLIMNDSLLNMLFIVVVHNNTYRVMKALFNLICRRIAHRLLNVII